MRFRAAKSNRERITMTMNRLGSLLFVALLVSGCAETTARMPLVEGCHDVIVIATEKGIEFDDVVEASWPDAEKVAFISGIIEKRKYLVINDNNSIKLTVVGGFHDTVIETQNFSVELEGEEVGAACDVILKHVRINNAPDEKGIINVRSLIAPGHKMFLGCEKRYNYYIYMPVFMTPLQRQLQQQVRQELRQNEDSEPKK
jgi:hypothetical protein